MAASAPGRVGAPSQYYKEAGPVAARRQAVASCVCTEGPAACLGRGLLVGSRAAAFGAPRFGCQLRRANEKSVSPSTVPYSLRVAPSKKVALRFCLLLLLLAAAQKLPAPDPSVAHCIGLARAPLYCNATDATGRTTKYLPSLAAAVAVGRLSPGGWWSSVLALAPSPRRASCLNMTPPPRCSLASASHCLRGLGARARHQLGCARAAAWPAQACPLANAVAAPGPSAG